MITLPSQSVLADLETFIRAVRQSPGQDLRLPIQVSRGGAFGFSAVAVQSVATWARLHEGTRQVQLTPSFHSDEGTRERFAGSLLGMCALYFADRIQAGSQMFSRGSALEIVAPRVFAMDQYRFRETLRGRGALLCCFQGARLEFVKALYTVPTRGTAEETSVRSIAQFTEVLTGLLEASSSGASRTLSSTQLQVLAALVHQLFKNADVHTVTDAKGALYDSGVRGLQVREVVIGDEDGFNDFVAGDPAFHGYLTKLGIREHVREKGLDGRSTLRTNWRTASFIEVTVFDTGPGLALRWLAHKQKVTQYAAISREEEWSAILECFRLHATTHTSAMRGDGLAIALQAMKELRAFMFLRTGRLAMYQDFTSKDHIEFRPQARYGGKGLLGEVAGATYSVCFPLPR